MGDHLRARIVAAFGRTQLPRRNIGSCSILALAYIVGDEAGEDRGHRSDVIELLSELQRPRVRFGG